MFDVLSMARGDNADDSDREYRFVTIEYGLSPNATQTRKLEEVLSACGSAYNHILAECKADAVMGIRQRKGGCRHGHPPEEIRGAHIAPAWDEGLGFHVQDPLLPMSA